VSNGRWNSGNAVSTINASERVASSSISNMADLLVAKAPGVIISPPNMSGAAQTIRIRGNSSISLNNDPIFIIDGVRMNSSTISAGLGGTNFSFLNTLSPEEIEDIEIVKGPSAATLYGTAAANGVIVVTTKKGKAGSTRWQWFGQVGSVQDRNEYPSTVRALGTRAIESVEADSLPARDGDTDDVYLRQPDVDQHSDGQGTVADRERQ
jgi:TonB-dependent SusC/RagA subfamily outer membrane receptor